tara:strand:- start:172 stop:363 length:192 start_codon:yes stop_codon:yes gene_type:complete
MSSYIFKFCQKKIIKIISSNLIEYFVPEPEPILESEPILEQNENIYTFYRNNDEDDYVKIIIN